MRALWTMRLVGLFTLVSALVFVAGAGGTTPSSLPGGTSIDAAVTYPLDGAVLPEAPLTITGSASVGTGQAVANTTLIYIVDVSGSTSAPTGGSLCPRQNVYDSTGNTTLDCELLAVRDLNQAAITAGTVAKIGFIGFSGTNTDTLASITSAAALDLDPALGPAATLVAPSLANFTPSGWTQAFPPVNNLDWVVQSAYLASGGAVPPLTGGWTPKGVSDGFTLFTAHDVGTSTNYYAALEVLKNLLPAVQTPQTQVVFLSDGLANQTVQGQSLQSLLNTLHPTNTNLTIDTFAVVGSGSTCGSPAGSLDGMLAQIAAAYGKSCVPLSNPEDATSAVPDVIASQLTSASLTVDGSPVATAASLPQPGPTSVTMTSSPQNLSVGSHSICAQATGHDGGGNGSAGPNCVTVTVKAPPTITVGDGTGIAGTTNEGTAFPVSATASDGTTSWTSSSPNCTFADPTLSSTTVTCVDNGTYSLTFTADDGVNPPVSGSETLTVLNVPPTPTLTLSAGPHPLGSSVTADVAIVDPGTLDTQGCAFDWGDGTPLTAVAATGLSCSAPHTYAAAGTYTVTVTVTDKDGGVGMDTKSVVIDGPPVVSVADASGNEGSAIPLVASATDPEGDPLTLAWTATPASAVDPGAACTFANPASASTTVTCNDNGTWTITLTASDAINPPVSQSATLTVANVAPTVTITSPAAGSSSRSVTFAATVTDPGSNDVLSCSIDWGDGSAAEVVAVVAGSCGAAHAYASSLQTATITVTASDDNGGSSTASRTVTFNQPPVCSAVKAVRRTCCGRRTAHCGS